MTPINSSSSTPMWSPTSAPTIFALPKEVLHRGSKPTETTSEATTGKVSHVACTLLTSWEHSAPLHSTSILDECMLPSESHEAIKSFKVLQADVAYLSRRIRDRDLEIGHLMREKEELQDANFCLNRKLEFLQRFIKESGAATSKQ